MAALTSVVTDYVSIIKVTGNIQTILANIKCRELRIWDMTLNQDDTECLLETMRNNVEEVEIADFEMAGSLDIDVLIQYDGLGKCSKVWCARYLDTLSNWASKV